MENETDILGVIKELSKTLPRFPDGRIDYTDSAVAPVVSIYVEHKGNILLLKRSEKVSTYRGKWNVIAGYLDEMCPIADKVYEELSEEAGILKESVTELVYGKPFEFHDPELGRTWIICPVLAKLTEKPSVKMDWEHTEYKWVKPEEISDHDTFPRISQGLKTISL